MKRLVLICLLLVIAFPAMAQPLTLNDVVFGSGRRAFQLADIGDLLLWIDVSEATNTTYAGGVTNGSPVNDIYRDLSPRNHAVQCSTITYVSTGGGYAGSSPYLIMTNASGSTAGTAEELTNSTSFTVVTVMKPLGIGDGGPFWADARTADGAGSEGDMTFGALGGHNQVNSDSYAISCGANLESDANSRSTNWQVLTLVSGGTNSSIWLDGVKIKTGTVGTSFPLINGPVGFSGWGGTVYSGVHYMEMLFARGLVYGHALTDAECDLVNRKCMDDFGFP